MKIGEDAFNFYPGCPVLYRCYWGIKRRVILSQVIFSKEQDGWRHPYPVIKSFGNVFVKKSCAFVPTVQKNNQLSLFRVPVALIKFFVFPEEHHSCNKRQLTWRIKQLYEYAQLSAAFYPGHFPVFSLGFPAQYQSCADPAPQKGLPAHRYPVGFY